MLVEITHLQTLTDDLKTLTVDPHKLPSASEQVATATTRLQTRFSFSQRAALNQTPDTFKMQPDGSLVMKDFMCHKVEPFLGKSVINFE